MQTPYVGSENPIDDRLAVLATQAGADGGAFERLALRVRAMVVRWAGAATGDRDEAEDVAQIVLLRLQRHVGDRSARGSLRSWLFRVTRNVVLDRRRTERRHQMLLDVADSDVLKVRETTVGIAAPPPLLPVVIAFLDALSPRQQEVFELVDLRGFSAAEAAARMDITASTARVLLMQARRTLRVKMLEQHPTLLEDYLP